MKSLLIASLLLSTAAVVASADMKAGRIPHLSTMKKHRGCVSKNTPEYAPVIKSARPHDYIKESELPKDFDWSNVNGTNYLTPSRNQHIPQYCGSCWAMSSTSALADRIKIQRKAQFPDVMIAVQTAVYCLESGCMGGNCTTVYHYAHEQGLPVDSCQNYVAKGTGQECNAIHTCENCVPTDDGSADCTPIKQFPKWYVSEFGSVLGVKEMKSEIYANGPIGCYIDANPIYNWGFGPNRTSVFTDGKGKDGIDHAISVVGWGYDPKQQVEYWRIRNSWGEYWGDQGYFRLKLGENQLGMEQVSCAWAKPDMHRH